jgi:hypothetical protein
MIGEAEHTHESQLGATAPDGMSGLCEAKPQQAEKCVCFGDPVSQATPTPTNVLPGYA